MTKRERRTFTQEFKLEIVKLYENGKLRSEIIREYELTPSTLSAYVSTKRADSPRICRSLRRSYA